MPIIAEPALWDRTRAALAAGDPPAGAPAVAGPAPGPGRRRPPLQDVLVARRSVRSFTGRPISPADLRQVLDTARAADERIWPALAVAGSAPAVVLSTPGDDLYDTVAAQYAAAPVLILVLADVASAATQAGGPGYRQCLLRAASFGYAAWLAALGADLGGSFYGRSSPQVTAAVRAGQRTSRRHILTVALGEPA